MHNIFYLESGKVGNSSKTVSYSFHSILRFFMILSCYKYRNTSNNLTNRTTSVNNLKLSFLLLVTLHIKGKKI